MNWPPRPLTGPAAWGYLPSFLREQGYDLVVINVQDDDEAPFADRYVAQATAQILPPRALAFFTEPLPATDNWPDAPCGYLRTSPVYDFWIRIAEQCGWPVVHRDLGYFATLCNSAATLDALLELTTCL